jgi:hypothetical protein
MLPRRARAGQGKAARAGRPPFDLAIFYDIFLRKHETSIMIFGYDADLRGLRDRASNAIAGRAGRPR